MLSKWKRDVPVCALIGISRYGRYMTKKGTFPMAALVTTLFWIRSLDLQKEARSSLLVLICLLQSRQFQGQSRKLL